MKIALLATIGEKIPPPAYGGTEAIVYTLAQELHRRGHDVTLFAAGDAEVDCKLVPIAEKAIGSKMHYSTREALTLRAIAEAVGHISHSSFDIVHNHTGWRGLLLKTLIPCPIVTTLHDALNDKYENGARERRMFNEFRSQPFISISKAQRRTAPFLRYSATIYHGINADEFKPSYQPGEYLAFLGRFSYLKGPREAIEIAKKTGNVLKMAGKINDFERDYFETEIKPHIDGKQIIFLGEINHKKREELLRGATALLSPIHWDEPFGLTNVEAYACGTPVIGMKRGSLPELIEHGKTGYLCRSLNEMIAAVGRLDRIDRRACRKHVETKFSVDRMITAHERLYKRLVAPRHKRFSPRQLLKRSLL
jgi:glycosyltransferase involved in cell wall biosynthesis